jgi:hypothetical protein
MDVAFQPRPVTSSRECLDRGFLPTGDTALFLLAVEARARWQTLLSGDHPLVQKGIVYAEAVSAADQVVLTRNVVD